jgi:hypothetical protein
VSDRGAKALAERLDTLGIANEPAAAVILGEHGLFIPDADKAHEPGDLHEYEMTCRVCGQPGTVQLNLVPVRAPDEPAP